MNRCIDCDVEIDEPSVTEPIKVFCCSCLEVRRIKRMDKDNFPDFLGVCKNCNAEIYEGDEFTLFLDDSMICGMCTLYYEVKENNA